jgi:hypothetical protein
MPAAPDDAVPLIEKALKRKKGIASALRDLDLWADELRAIAERIASGFSHKILGVGEVTVSAAKARRLTGQLPELVPERFLALDAAEQASLRERGVVVTVSTYSPEAKPSVTVKLA